MYLSLAFPRIPQLIAYFCSVCLFNNAIFWTYQKLVASFWYLKKPNIQKWQLQFSFWSRAANVCIVNISYCNIFVFNILIQKALIERHKTGADASTPTIWVPQNTQNSRKTPQNSKKKRSKLKENPSKLKELNFLAFLESCYVKKMSQKRPWMLLYTFTPFHTL